MNLSCEREAGRTDLYGPQEMVIFIMFLGPLRLLLIYIVYRKEQKDLIMVYAIINQIEDLTCVLMFYWIY